jgi:hypothetical protein
LGGGIVIALSADGQLIALLDMAGQMGDAPAGGLCFGSGVWFWVWFIVPLIGRFLQGIAKHRLNREVQSMFC